MFSYNIVNKPLFNINKKYIDKILFQISNIVKKEQTWSINIVFLDDISIKNLNNNYRWINKSTDVLSFHYYEKFSNFKKSDIIWEIVMSEEKIKSQALEYWLWEEKEFYKLLIHSVLHILGYDHELDEDYKIMQPLEDKIWKEIFKTEKSRKLTS